MKSPMDVRGWVRVTWLVVAFTIVGIGIGCIWWPASQNIAQRHSHALELYDEANAIDATTRRASQLRAAQRRITRDLAELRGVRSPGEITAAVLQLLHEESKDRGVEVREVAPDTNVHSPSAPERKDASSKPGSGVLASSDVSIEVRGPFRNIVALVADLPRHEVLIDVHDIELSSADSTHRLPVLDATLHTTIYRLVSLPMPGSSLVRTVR